MIANATVSALSELYEVDETAWLEAMSRLVREGRLEELDYGHLADYLGDMARRDKREVGSGLATLIAHLLKWQYQPENRGRSWRGTIESQRQELVELLESGILRNHAEEVLAKAYSNGVRLAAAETDLPASTFPESCPYDLESLLAEELGG